MSTVIPDNLPVTIHRSGRTHVEETWDDDLAEVLAKWRQDPANLEPEFCPCEEDEDD